jgi:hypothetical protein
MTTDSSLLTCQSADELLRDLQRQNPWWRSTIAGASFFSLMAYAKLWAIGESAGPDRSQGPRRYTTPYRATASLRRRYCSANYPCVVR